MADFDKPLESLYTHFLLRDFAGKIVPGSVLYVAFFSSIAQGKFLQLDSKLPLATTMILLGFLWLLGLAIQAIGAWFGIVKYSEKYPPPDEFHQAQRKFRNIKGDHSRDIMRYERFEAIREAYGNGAVSVLISFPIWLLGHVFRPECGFLLILFVFFVSVALFIALRLGHEETIRHFDAFWEHAINRQNVNDSDDS